MWNLSINDEIYDYIHLASDAALKYITRTKESVKLYYENLHYLTLTVEDPYNGIKGENYQEVFAIVENKMFESV